MIRVALPYHLSNLAKVGREVAIEVDSPVTQRKVLDALEAAHPTLRGTIRDQATQRRRPFIRFFGCGRICRTRQRTIPCPEVIATGIEPFWVVGAVAGG